MPIFEYVVPNVYIIFCHNFQSLVPYIVTYYSLAHLDFVHVIMGYDEIDVGNMIKEVSFAHLKL